MANKYIGLDIGVYSIKCVSMQSDGESMKLNHCYVLPTPEDAIVDGNIIDYADVTEQLVKVMDSGGFPKMPISLSMKGSTAIAKFVRIPYVNIDTIDDDIRFFSDQYILADTDDYSIDYKILSKNKDTAVVDVVIAATKKESLSDYVSVLESAEQKLSIVDIEVIALADLCDKLGMPVEGYTMIVDIGHSNTQIVFMYNGRFDYYETSSCSGQYCTGLLVNMAKAPLESIDMVKATPDAFPMGSEVKKIIVNNFIPDLIRATDKALANYTLLGRDVPNRIYLSGGGATTYNLLEGMEEHYKVKVEVMDPSKYITVENPIAKQVLNQTPALLNIALSMALRK